VKDIQGRLSPGAIGVDMPVEAKEGDTFDVTVKITRANLADVDRVLAAMNAARGAAIAEKLQVATRMYVDARSPDAAFKITRTSPQTRQQILPDSGMAAWVFAAEAEEAGKHPIVVEAGVAAKIMDEDTTVYWKTFSKDVTVTVSEAWRSKSFFERHSEAVWGAVITALVGAVAAVAGYLLKRWWERNHP
jgi:hypothetical protein